MYKLLFIIFNGIPRSLFLTSLSYAIIPPMKTEEAPEKDVMIVDIRPPVQLSAVLRLSLHLLKINRSF